MPNTDDTRHGAGILFTNGKRALLLRRAEKVGKGTWGIPGGRAEFGEEPIETAKRESKEEIGQVQGTQFAQFTFNSSKMTFVTFLFAIDDKFDCELSDEHDKYKWVKIDELNEYKLHDKFKEHLPKYIEAINNYFGKEYSFKEWLKFNN